MAASDPAITFRPLKLPTWWTFAALAAGLVLGWVLADSPAIGPVLAVAEPLGTLWLRALQVTIIPLVAALLISGVAQIAATAAAGPLARRTLLTIMALLAVSAIASVLLMPLLLDAFPVPGSAPGLLTAGAEAAPPVPGLGDFVEALVAPNIFAAAAETAMLPLVVFFIALAVAITQLPPARRQLMTDFFDALGQAMLTIIGWVLAVAPVGVFALAVGVAATSRGGAFAALGHYILLVSAMGVVVTLLGYIVAVALGRARLVRFATAMLPAQAVALSTQSSLASLPAMLATCRQLDVRTTTAEFVLPLAVALFRATSPAMNLAVVIYVADVSGVALTPASMVIGVAFAILVSLSSVSLPGTISFIASVGPIALAMGVPIEPLALLVAVEMLPDIMRTIGNVTADVALTMTVDAHEEGRDDSGSSVA